MKVTLGFSIIFFLLCVKLGFGQNTEPDFDTNYIETFRDKLIITAVSALNTNSISVTDKQGEDVVFSTNVPLSFGLALDYKWLTAEYTSSFGASGDERFGKTEMRSLGFGITSRKIWFRNFYQKSSGYYVQNPEYFIPDFDPENDLYPHRADVSTSIYFASLNYGFNYKKFSNMASLWQLERQKKSAGSLTAGLAFSYSTFNADSVLIPYALHASFESESILTGYYYTMIGANLGYLYTFAFGKKHKLFLSLALVPGLSYQTGKAFKEDGSSFGRQSGIGVHGEGRVIVGFNGDDWYTSVSGVSYVVSNSISEYNPMVLGYNFFRVVVGIKIKVPESKSAFLKKVGL